MPHSVNVDEQEINHFNQQAHQWWDPNGQFNALHKLNPLRMDFIQQHQTLMAKQVLDVGCGGGILSEAMAQAGAEVTGLDLAADLLQIARLHALDTGVNVHYVLDDVAKHAQSNSAQYDMVTCMEMLEHVPDPQAILHACAQAVKPGGWVFCSTLNRSNKSLLLAVITAEYVLNLVPRGTHHHDKFIKPSELTQMGREAGLVMQKTAGMEFNPILKRYRLNDDLSINYLMAFQKPLNPAS
ncbi:bifunctional 2-polyprenyl-6-hydroxyphenol methylase/3-demethylubiquinol 3-O-methyltransferase UbiG [Thiomicrospira cyclica]|uniref:Ubiquinone biosynthesis O-methyltransferase n=1 Tax=Thiomicrospira cyclica (strain DSM 14477 / JCM 11371 / ALM1) TaxID=717773 RepID=F6DCK7_THICA|nr:bifunctional 2-polyprenyl-6-hydroxyphenol methylase/3-demethylubiquinol 3-O-methyltransferase UbiG [Thiomicrospira cyclica]AEG31593.1 3-demethylubiquinone-9 3-methyltransferase [Thiomicrospira cyclica ALM1]